MSAQKPSPVAKYFGTQVRKHRIAAKLTLQKLTELTQIDTSHLSKLERGERNPTPDIARKLDRVFYPGADVGHFMELYEASRSWVPAAFRRWAEYEDQATQLLSWSPYTVDGLLQTTAYTRALLETARLPADAMTGRIRNRLDRQQRILYRDEPPRCVFIVDVLSLLREVGNPEVMTEQLHHLVQVAELPHVTMTVMPAVAHNANESPFIIGDGAVYTESSGGGGVYTDQVLAALSVKFDTLRADCYRRGESLSIIKTLEDVWKRGASPLTQVLMAGSA